MEGKVRGRDRKERAQEGRKGKVWKGRPGELR